MTHTPDTACNTGDHNELDFKQLNYNDFSRSEVRSLIFHLIYAMEGFDYQASLESIVDNFNLGFGLNIPFDSEVFKTADAIIHERDELDELIKPLLHNWRFERIGVITKLILRLALWEMHNTDTPPTVIINEAIELAKCFGEQDSYKFINGLLDEQAKKLADQKK